MKMHTEHGGNELTDFRAVPLQNLAQALGERAIVTLALNAVQTLADKYPDSAARQCAASCQPRMMLTLLSYCYAMGIYGSQQICQAIREDPMVRYICAKEFPDEDTIRRFRRQNRGLIDQCLNYILKQAWALRFDQAEVDFPGYDWIENVWNQAIQTETGHRIELAVFMDLMQTDDA